MSGDTSIDDAIRAIADVILKVVDTSEVNNIVYTVSLSNDIRKCELLTKVYNHLIDSISAQIENELREKDILNRSRYREGTNNVVPGDMRHVLQHHIYNSGRR